MNKKTIIISIFLLFVGYSAVDSFIMQPGTRPDYCDDCMLPEDTEHAQQTTIIESIIMVLITGWTKIKNKIKKVKS